MSNTIQKKTYYKNGDGFVLNQFYKDGADVILFPKQAKYLLAPLGTELRTNKKKVRVGASSAPKKNELASAGGGN